MGVSRDMYKSAFTYLWWYWLEQNDLAGKEFKNLYVKDVEINEEGAQSGNKGPLDNPSGLVQVLATYVLDDWLDSYTNKD